MPTLFRAPSPADRRFCWELNELNVPHVGTVTPEQFERLCAISPFTRIALVEGMPAGFLLALTAEADYASPNFRWFKERYRDFLYVDRLAVAAVHRKLGVGADLYREAERHARAAGLTMVCCEVNLEPPNPDSLAFHGRIGFTRAGEQQLGAGKRVAMLVKPIPASSDRAG